MTEEQTNGEEKIQDPEAYAQAPEWFQASVPEFYADTINVSIGAYGTSITFGVRSFRGPEPKARVFMSHQMALVMERLVRRILITYERDNEVTISLPHSVLTTLKLTDSDFEELVSDHPAPAETSGQESPNES